MPPVVVVRLERDPAIMTLIRSDLKEAVVDLAHDAVLPFDGVFERVTQFFNANAMLIETTRGEYIGVEVPTIEDLAPRGDRPVIYLDQKDWSTLANTLYKPSKVAVAEREAAWELIDMARARKVILPMSSAHISETCKWSAREDRYRLALTILQLSGGWQMRDPLEVRRLELRRSFLAAMKGMDTPPMEAFTLEPNAIHGRVRGRLEREDPLGFTPELTLVHRSAVGLLVSVSLMHDQDHIPMSSTPGWVKKNRGFTEWLAGESSRNSAQKRKCIDVFFFADAQKEVAEEAHRAGITPEELGDWVREHYDGEVSRMPLLGLFREVLIGKHLNQKTTWKNTDLIDLMNLTCAAAYADYVVGERSLIGQISDGNRRLKRSGRVYRCIQDVMPHVREHLGD
jgi:hypothetical protein